MSESGLSRTTSSVHTRGNLVVPQSDEEYRSLVFRGEFRFLTDLLSSGQLKEFEHHSFMKRVAEHGLLGVPTPNASALASLDSGALRIALSGSWPTDRRVNAVSWSISSDTTRESGLIERRSGASTFAAQIRFPVTPLIDVLVVFGIKTKSGHFIGSPSRFRSREEFTYEPGSEKHSPVERPVVLKEFPLQRKTSWLPWVPRILGTLGIVTIVLLLIFRL